MSFFNANLFESQPELLNGNVQIIACAGSGKTEFVAERIAYTLYKNIAKPDQIVAFTFTKKAAEELKIRIRTKTKELLGKQPDLGDMFIGTIHSFALKIIQEYTPKYRTYDVLNEFKRLAFLFSLKKIINFRELFEELNKDNKWNFHIHGNWRNWTYRTFLRDADIIREKGLSEDSMISDRSRKAYSIYIDQLENQRFLDFSGILRIAVNLLKNDAFVRNEIREKYKCFTVDEYQDINPIQEELIQIISNQQNVCVVGDDDQSIYQWRGADIQNIITFKKRYKNVAIYNLAVNWRSCTSIIKAADELIQRNNPNRLSKSIQCNELKSEDGDLYKLGFENQKEEIDWIICKIKSLIGTEFIDGKSTRKFIYSDFAILFRSVKNEAGPFIEKLLKHNIPVIYTGTGGLFKTEEITTIIDLFKYISNFNDSESYDDEYLREVFRKLPTMFSLSFEKFKSDLQVLKDNSLALAHFSLQSFYIELLTIIGISDKSCHTTINDVLLFNLGKFSQAISDYESSRSYIIFVQIKDFISFINQHSDNTYDSGNSDAMAGTIDAVQILTMHGTKGLGFPVVFMPSNHPRNHNPEFGPTFLDINNFDSKRFINSLEDERRLYYVAITRAKKYLFITCSKFKVNKKHTTFVTSLFNEVSDDYFMYFHIPDPTERKKCDIDISHKGNVLNTSYTKIDCYLGCGYDYKIRYVYGFQPELSSSIEFGKQVHNVINLLHKNYERTRKIPNIEEIDKVINNNFFIRSATSQEKDILKSYARKSIFYYRTIWENDLSVEIKTEQAFEIEFGNALISGSIDMIKRNNERALEVIDFKTSKKDSEYLNKYELQLQLYSLALQKSSDYPVGQAYIHFISSVQSERLIVDTSYQAIERAKDKFNSAIDGIINTNFDCTGLINGHCTSCIWSNICPKV